MNKTKYKEPAQFAYFFIDAWKDLWKVICGTFERHSATSKTIIDDGEVFGLHLPRNKFGLLMKIGAIATLWSFGLLIVCVLSIVHSLIVALLLLGTYILSAVVCGVDALYRAILKSHYKCSHLHTFALPIYKCPSCGEIHRKLVPGRYGVWKRKCNCGEKLPANLFVGRHKLSGACPECEHWEPINNVNESGGTGLSRAFCVQVVGSASVGKSTFITAYIYDFLKDCAVKGLNISPSTKETITFQSKLTDWYEQGAMEKTRIETDASKTSAKDFEWELSGDGFKIARKLHLIDIAGETFQRTDFNELLHHLRKECQGLIWMIDPLSLPSVRRQFESALSEADKAGMSVETPDAIDNFISYLKSIGAIKAKAKSSIPFAIVINKSDELDDYIGQAAINKLLGTETCFGNYYDTMDYVCRKFLCENGFADKISVAVGSFKNVRFFSASPVGHSLNGTKYQPRDVSAVMSWFYKLEDRGLYNKCADEKHTFEANRLPVAEVNII